MIMQMAIKKTMIQKLKKDTTIFLMRKKSKNKRKLKNKGVLINEEKI